MLWGRPILDFGNPPDMEAVKNIDHVFHGHTIVKTFRVVENRTFMDLGSYNNAKLGFMHPDDYLEHLETLEEKVS